MHSVSFIFDGNSFGNVSRKTSAYSSINSTTSDNIDSFLEVLFSSDSDMVAQTANNSAFIDMLANC
jgi:hypothetical protein